MGGIFKGGISVHVGSFVNKCKGLGLSESKVHVAKALLEQFRKFDPKFCNCFPA